MTNTEISLGRVETELLKDLVRNVSRIASAMEDDEDDETDLMDQAIGTEAGHVKKRFESWDDAEEWRDNGHARNVYGIPALTEEGEYHE